MSHGDNPVLLQPGVETQVRAPGDFVFLKKAAFPVEVTIRGQTVEMEPGEVRNIPRSEYNQVAFDSFTAKNMGAADQQVVFVVGEGSYNKVIVSGEMNVSAYVKTGRGESLSLPMEIRRECGVIDLDEISYTGGTMITSSVTSDSDSTSATTVYYRGDFYCFVVGAVAGRIYRFSENSTVDGAEDLGEWAYPVPGDNLIHATVDESGTVYILFQYQDGGETVPLVGFFNILEPNNESEWGALSLDDLSSGSHHKIHYFGGRIYYHSDQSFGDVASVTVDGLTEYREEPGLGGGWSYGFGNYFWTMTITGGTLNRILPGGGVVDTGVTVPSQEFQTSIVGSFNEHGTAFCQYISASDNGGQGKVEIYRHADFSTYGRLYIQPVGDSSRRLEYPLIEPGMAGIQPVQGGQVVRANWVDRVVFSAGGVYDYSDYVTGYEFDNGLVTKTYDSGTQTFARRGMLVPETMHIFDGSEVVVKILPEAILG